MIVDRTPWRTSPEAFFSLCWSCVNFGLQFRIGEMNAFNIVLQTLRHCLYPVALLRRFLLIDQRNLVQFDVRMVLHGRSHDRHGHVVNRIVELDGITPYLVWFDACQIGFELLRNIEKKFDVAGEQGVVERCLRMIEKYGIALQTDRG